MSCSRSASADRGPEGEVTPSTTFAFALVLIAGFLAVPLIVLVSLVCDRMTGKSAIKVVFNAGQYALTVFASATVLAVLIGPPLAAPGVPFHPADLAGVLSPASRSSPSTASSSRP